MSSSLEKGRDELEPGEVPSNHWSLPNILQGLIKIHLKGFLHIFKICNWIDIDITNKFVLYLYV